MKKVITALIILCILFVGITIIIFSGNNNDNFNKLDDLKNKNVGIQSGTIYGDIIKEKIPKAKLKYYDNYDELIKALKEKKIDGFAIDEPIIKFIMLDNPEIDFIPTKLNEDYFAYALNKNKRGNKILSELDEYIDTINNNGMMTKYIDIWFGDDENEKVVDDYTKFAGKNGKIVLGVEAYNEPFVYLENNNIKGFEIAIIVDFCKAYNYSLEIKTYSFDDLLLPDDNIDIRCSSISITEDRKKLFNFSKPTYENCGVIAILKPVDNETFDINNIKDVEDLNYGKVGILAGTVFENVIHNYAPNTKIILYDNINEMFKAISTGEIDGTVIDDSIAKYYLNKYDNLLLLDKLLTYDSYGFIFKNERNNVLYDEFNDYLTSIKKNGKLTEIEEHWIINNNDKINKEINLNNLKNINGELNVLIPEMRPEPFVYEIDGLLQGYDVEILYNFCKEKGYSVNLTSTTYNDIFNKLSNEDYDIGLGDLTINEERKQLVKFSKETYIGGIVTVIRDIEKDLIK